MPQKLRSAASGFKHQIFRFTFSEEGAVAVAATLALPVMLGVTGLAIEYSDALVTRAETQRVADLAVHAAVLAYGPNGDTQAMTHAAWSVAVLNGVPAGNTRLSLSEDSAAGPVVRVHITTPRPIVLAQLVSASHSIDVTVRASAQLVSSEPACVQALAPEGTGITLSGGTSITASTCAVSSNASVTASGSGKITTNTLTYDSDSAPEFSGGASVGSPNGGETTIIRTSTPDPFEEHEGVLLAAARLAAAGALTAPVAPAVGMGPDISFGWNVSQTQQTAIAVGCTASLAGNTWTFACPAGATVNLGNLGVDYNYSLNFGLQESSGTTYSFSGAIRTNGTTVRFGPGSYNIAKGIFTAWGMTTHFAAGTYRIGKATDSCGGVIGYSICKVSTMVFAGPSVFELAGGIHASSMDPMVLGTGQGNSIRIGAAANGDAITLAGSGAAELGDATGPGDRFQLIGNVTSGGSSCLKIGPATNHDIAGHFSLAGGITFGGGLYAIDGYLHLGVSGGGSVLCQNQSVSMTALGATFALSGKGVPQWTCNGSAFCAAGGYSGMQLVAPTSGPFANLAVLGALSPSAPGGASFTAGAYGSRISGAFYFPNGPITLSGGASAGGSAEGCLQLVGSTVDLIGGTTAASECIASGSGAAIARLIE